MFLLEVFIGHVWTRNLHHWWIVVLDHSCFVKLHSPFPSPPANRSISPLFARTLEVFKDRGEQIVRVYARAPSRSAGHGVWHLFEDQPEMQEKIHDPPGTLDTSFMCFLYFSPSMWTEIGRWAHSTKVLNSNCFMSSEFYQRSRHNVLFTSGGRPATVHFDIDRRPAKTHRRPSGTFGWLFRILNMPVCAIVHLKTLFALFYSSFLSFHYFFFPLASPSAIILRVRRHHVIRPGKYLWNRSNLCVC